MMVKSRAYEPERERERERKMERSGPENRMSGAEAGLKYGGAGAAHNPLKSNK